MRGASYAQCYQLRMTYINVTHAIRSVLHMAFNGLCKFEACHTLEKSLSITLEEDLSFVLHSEDNILRDRVCTVGRIVLLEHS